MEFCRGSSWVDSGNVVNLCNSSSSSVLLGDSSALAVGGHRCGFECQVEHVWGNLYRCKATGTPHICDNNCDQRILYDNHTTICRCSRKILPFRTPEGQTIRGARRKHESDSEELLCPLKRNRGGGGGGGDCIINPNPNTFFKRHCYTTADPVLQLGESCMDLN